MPGFTVDAIEPLTLEAKPPLSEMYTLSPFVWKDGGRWEMLVRAVPRRDDQPALKIACAYYGLSEDGLHRQWKQAARFSCTTASPTGKWCGLRFIQRQPARDNRSRLW